MDYLVRLEQGRALHPSALTVAALARALRLDDDERDALHRLAGLAPPSPGTISGHVPPGVQRIVDRLGDIPVAVFTAAWTLLRWSHLWAATLGDPSPATGRDRNLVWAHFMGSGSRVVHEGEELVDHERELVADLRAAALAYPDDRDLAELVGDLQASSPAFRRLWARFDVRPRTADRKTVRHPEVGDLRLDCTVVRTVQSDLRIMVFTAEPGTESASRLDLLRVVGMQQTAG